MPADIPKFLPADEDRILGIAAPAVLGVLRRRRETTLSRLHGDYRAGVSDFRSTVAEFVTLTELIQELERKLEAANN